jgi:hypothetical protein
MASDSWKCKSGTLSQNQRLAPREVISPIIKERILFVKSGILFRIFHVLCRCKNTSSRRILIWRLNALANALRIATNLSIFVACNPTAGPFPQSFAAVVVATGQGVVV